MKKLQLFHQNHALSPLQKCQFCLHFKSMFILSRKAFFLTRTSPNTFSELFWITRNLQKISNFWPKPWTNPFGKMLILWVFETDVFVVEKGLFAIWNVENRFFTIYFRDLWHGNTGGYWGLQGVTRDYRGLKAVTRGYKGLLGATSGYKGLQGVTRGDTGWQGMTGGYKG